MEGRIEQWQLRRRLPRRQRRRKRSSCFSIQPRGRASVPFAFGAALPNAASCPFHASIEFPPIRRIAVLSGILPGARLAEAFWLGQLLIEVCPSQRGAMFWQLLSRPTTIFRKPQSTLRSVFARRKRAPE